MITALTAAGRGPHSTARVAFACLELKTICQDCCTQLVLYQYQTSPAAATSVSNHCHPSLTLGQMRGADCPLSTGPSAPGDHMRTKAQEACPVLYQKNGHQLLACWEASLNCHVLKSLASLIICIIFAQMPEAVPLGPVAGPAADPYCGDERSPDSTGNGGAAF